MFGGEVRVHGFAEFGRGGGPRNAVAHGILSGGPVDLYAADAADGEPALSSRGLMLSLLGTADAATLRAWFARLAEGGTVVEDLEERSWDATSRSPLVT